MIGKFKLISFHKRIEVHTSVGNPQLIKLQYSSLIVSQFIGKSPFLVCSVSWSTVEEWRLTEAWWTVGYISIIQSIQVIEEASNYIGTGSNLLVNNCFSGFTFKQRKRGCCKIAYWRIIHCRWKSAILSSLDCWSTQRCKVHNIRNCKYITLLNVLFFFLFMDRRGRDHH